MRILTVKGAGNFNAGPKAPSDIIEILINKYNAKSELLIQKNGIIGKINYRLKIFFTILKSRIKNEVLVMQFPMYETTKILNKLFLFSLNFINKNKTVVLIHDLDSIRSEDEILKKQELDRLSKVKYIIVHNEKMKKYLEKLDIKAKMYNLEIFDYLCDKKEDFERRKFPPNELPDKIDGDLGLIWDGNFDESDENIKFKNYTKYNNPHKLSCYTASGIPVIVWRKAAIADFVKKYNIGYTISNIYDINNLNLADYKEKVNNIKNLQRKVRSGFFTINAMEKVLKDMGE